MDFKDVLLIWFINFLRKSPSLTDKSAKGGSFNNKIKQNQQLANELHKTIIKEFKKKEEFILHLKTIFGVLIQLICN